MNLDLFKKQLIRSTANMFSWSECEGDDNSVVIQADHFVRAYDDGISLMVKMNRDGNLTVRCIFDSIAVSYETLKLVNFFNQNVPYFKMYISNGRQSFITLDYINPSCETINEACSSVIESLKLLESELTVKYLQPITVITEG